MQRSTRPSFSNRATSRDSALWLSDTAQLPASPHITGERWDTRAWSLLIVLCGVVLLDGLDISMIGVALPSIGEDLGISTSSLGVGGSPTYAVAILPPVLLAGVGFAIGFPALNIQATAGVADHEQGLASGLVNMSFQVGGAVVTAVVSAVITSGGCVQPSLSALDNGVVVIIASASLGLLATFAGGLAWWRARPAAAVR